MTRRTTRVLLATGAIFALVWFVAAEIRTIDIGVTTQGPAASSTTEVAIGRSTTAVGLGTRAETNIGTVR